MSFLVKFAGLLVCLFTAFESKADLASDIARASESQLLIAGKKMADALAQTAPSQIDRSTVLAGGVFSPDTKTVIYQYNSSIALDSSKMHPYIGQRMCNDPVKMALMNRGFKYRHDYTTPIGIQSVVISCEDC